MKAKTKFRLGTVLLLAIAAVASRKEIESAQTPADAVTPSSGSQADGCLCENCTCGADCRCVQGACLCADCPDNALAPQEEPTPAYVLNVPEIVEPEIPEPEPTHSASGYLTTDAIRDWIHSHYQQGQSLRWGVNPSSAVWRHLQDGNEGTHVWQAWQVEDLSQWEALALHDATHRGLIQPTSHVSASPSGLTVTRRADGYAYWSHGGRWYRWHTLVEGTTYGGRFVYRSGRMHVLETPEVMVTRERERTVTIDPAPVRIYSSGGCANGNCARPMTFGRRGRR